MFGLGRYRYVARRAALQRLASRTHRRLVVGGNILIVAPHPDDETFGTGGLIATATRGDSSSARSASQVNVVFLTSGTGSHRGCCDIGDTELASKREATAAKAATILGVPTTNLHFLRLRDGALPRVGAVDFEHSCRQLADVISRVEPQQIFTTSPFESWPDHLAAEELTRCALRQTASEAELYHYCVWAWIKMPLQRAHRADWSDALVLEASVGGEQKERAIRAYLEDLAPCGNPYCGRLGEEFLRAVRGERELFFACETNGRVS